MLGSYPRRRWFDSTPCNKFPVIIATKLNQSRPVANAARAYGSVLFTCFKWLAGAGILRVV